MSHATSSDANLPPADSSGESIFSLHVTETDNGPLVSLSANLENTLVAAVIKAESSVKLPDHETGKYVPGILMKMLPKTDKPIFTAADLRQRAFQDDKWSSIPCKAIHCMTNALQEIKKEFLSEAKVQSWPDSARDCLLDTVCSEMTKYMDQLFSGAITIGCTVDPVFDESKVPTDLDPRTSEWLEGQLGTHHGVAASDALQTLWALSCQRREDHLANLALAHAIAQLRLQKSRISQSESTNLNQTKANIDTFRKLSSDCKEKIEELEVQLAQQVQHPKHVSDSPGALLHDLRIRHILDKDLSFECDLHEGGDGGAILHSSNLNYTSLGGGGTCHQMKVLQSLFPVSDEPLDLQKVMEQCGSNEDWSPLVKGFVDVHTQVTDAAALIPDPDGKPGSEGLTRPLLTKIACHLQRHLEDCIHTARQQSETLAERVRRTADLMSETENTARHPSTMDDHQLEEFIDDAKRLEKFTEQEHTMREILHKLSCFTLCQKRDQLSCLISAAEEISRKRLAEQSLGVLEQQDVLVKEQPSSGEQSDNVTGQEQSDHKSLVQSNEAAVLPLPTDYEDDYPKVLDKSATWAPKSSL